MTLENYEELLTEVTQLSDEVVAHYLLSKDQFYYKIPEKDAQIWITEAINSGRNAAQALKKESSAIKELYEKYHINLTIDEQNIPANQSQYIFAEFQPPQEVTIFGDFFENQKVFDNIDPMDVVLSHEFFHFWEEQHETTIFTRQKVLTYKVGFIKRTIALRSLSEIGATAFAKEYQNLNETPIVLDSILVKEKNIHLAKAICQEILKYNEKQ